MAERARFSWLYGMLLLAGAVLLGQGSYLQGKAWLAHWLIERSWQRGVAEGGEMRPWPWADTHVIARLRVAELGVERFVLAGASGRNLAFGPAHVSASAALSEAGSKVIAGHNDTHFAFLAELRPGMDIELALLSGEVLHYRVTSRTVVSENDTAQAAEPGLYLVTCYPFDALTTGTSLRLLFGAEAASSSSSSTTSSA